MHPILFSLGTWGVRAYDFFLTLAIVLGLTVFWLEAIRAGFSGGSLIVFALGSVSFALVGGGLNSILFHPGREILASLGNGEYQFPGIISYGSVIGFLVFVGLFALREGWNILAFLDLAAPVIPLAEFVLRWGCLMNGCCYGKTTNGWGGVYLPNATGQWANRYPTQILTAFFCLGLFFWLWHHRSEKTKPGEGILLYLAAYYLGRFGIGFLRGDQVSVLGQLTAHQLSSLVIGTLAMFGLQARQIRSDMKED